MLTRNNIQEEISKITATTQLISAYSDQKNCIERKTAHKEKKITQYRELATFIPATNIVYKTPIQINTGKLTEHIYLISKPVNCTFRIKKQSTTKD